MSLPATDDEVLLLHNPRCSKSRAARELLVERGIEFEERRYLDQPLSRAELTEVSRRLGEPLSAWIRRGEKAFADAGLGQDSSEAALLDAVAEHPVLMERPIVVRGSRAAVGRPPEHVLALFE